MARAYIDQLQRSEALAASLVAELDMALDRSAARVEDDARDADLAARLESLAAELNMDSGDAVTNRRMDALAETLGGIAAALR